MKREQRLIEVYRMMHERKNANVIYNEFSARGIPVSRTDIRRDVDLIKETKKLIKKGYTTEKILKELRKKGYRFGDKPLRKIINLKKPVVKPIRKKAKIVIVRSFLTRAFHEDDYTEHDLTNLDDVPIEDIYNRIREYNFKVETRYDEILVDVDREEVEGVRKARYDERRLTFGKLKYIFHTIFEKTERENYRFNRLKYDEILDIVNVMLRMFRDEEVMYRSKNFSVLGKIREIIIEKEVEGI